jgi:hypothetical protein
MIMKDDGRLAGTTSRNMDAVPDTGMTRPSLFLRALRGDYLAVRR